MILAGIDEAGLGPRLGPLATASFAISCPGVWLPSSPWRELGGVFCEHPRSGGAGLPVCDSKALYPAGGMRALELAVGVLSGVTSGGRGLQAVVSHSVHPAHVCYGDILSPFPLVCEADEIEECGAGVKRALEYAGASCVHFSIRILHEPGFNAVLESGLNKNQLLLSETGAHLSRLVERFRSEERLLIIVDKQGGRNSYGAYLSGLFPGAWPVELESGRERSTYRLDFGGGGGGGEVTVVFQAKADRDSFCTAAASLAAKYARERAVASLNEWFCARVSGLRPTAGYPQDARRWLEDIGERCDELGVGLLLRNK